MKPAAPHGICGGIGVAPVFLHDGGAAVHDLTDLADRHVVHVGVHQTHFDIHQGLTHRAVLPECVLSAQNASGRTHLGLAEDVEDRHVAERVGHGLQHRRRSGRGAPGDAFERVIELSGQCGLADGLPLCGDEVPGDHPSLRHGLERLDGVEVQDVDENRCATDEDVGEHPRQSADVEQRQAGQPDFAVTAHPLLEADVDGVHQQVHVGEYRALGLPGCSRGVHDESGLVLVDVDVERAVIGLQEGVVIDCLLDILVVTAADDKGARSCCLRGPGRQQMVGEQHRGVRIVENIDDLGHRQPEIDRHDDRTELQYGEVGLDQLEPVEHQHGDPVATFDSEGLQSPGQPVGAGIEFAVAQRMAVVLEGYAVGNFPCVASELISVGHTPSGGRRHRRGLESAHAAPRRRAGEQAFSGTVTDVAMSAQPFAGLALTRCFGGLFACDGC